MSLWQQGSPNRLQIFIKLVHTINIDNRLTKLWTADRDLDLRARQSIVFFASLGLWITLN